MLPEETPRSRESVTAQSRWEDPHAEPAADRDFASRRLPGTPAGEAGGMLPGMAVIGMYLLFIAMYTALQVLRMHAIPNAARYSILAVSTLVVIGAFGLLRLKRWGWALETGGCLIMAAGNFLAYHQTHAGPFIIQGLFALVFFLYLSRTEVRERLR